MKKFVFVVGAVALFTLGYGIRLHYNLNVTVASVRRGGVRYGDGGVVTALTGDSTACMFATTIRDICRESKSTMLMAAVPAVDPLPHDRGETFWALIEPVLARERPGCVVIDLDSYLLDATGAIRRWDSSGNELFVDRGHISSVAARRFAPQLRAALQPAQAMPRGPIAAWQDSSRRITAANHAHSGRTGQRRGRHFKQEKAFAMNLRRGIDFLRRYGLRYPWYVAAYTVFYVANIRTKASTMTQSCRRCFLRASRSFVWAMVK